MGASLCSLTLPEGLARRHLIMPGWPLHSRRRQRPHMMRITSPLPSLNFRRMERIFRLLSAAVAGAAICHPLGASPSADLKPHRASKVADEVAAEERAHATISFRPTGSA